MIHNFQAWQMITGIDRAKWLTTSAAAIHGDGANETDVTAIFVHPPSLRIACAKGIPTRLNWTKAPSPSTFSPGNPAARSNLCI